MVSTDPTTSTNGTSRGISPDEVKEAHDGLRADGVDPTPGKIRERLGNTGSFATIYRHLKALGLYAGKSANGKTSLPDPITASVEKVYADIDATQEEARNLL